MGNNSQSRKWSLVINNPLEAGLDHTAISEKLHACFLLRSIAVTLFYRQKAFPHSPY